MNFFFKTLTCLGWGNKEEKEKTTTTTPTITTTTTTNQQQQPPQQPATTPSGQTVNKVKVIDHIAMYCFFNRSWP